MRVIIPTVQASNQHGMQTSTIHFDVFLHICESVAYKSFRLFLSTQTESSLTVTGRYLPSYLHRDCAYSELGIYPCM